MNKVPRWVFRYMGSKTFDFSSKKRIFCPKMTKFGPKLAFWVNLGQAMQAYSVPCWWVVWWLSRAGCISQGRVGFVEVMFGQRFRDCALIEDL